MKTLPRLLRLLAPFRGWVALAERLSWGQWLGVAFVMLGIGLIVAQTDVSAA